MVFKNRLPTIDFWIWRSTPISRPGSRARVENPGPARPIGRWGRPDFKEWTEIDVENALMGRNFSVRPRLCAWHMSITKCRLKVNDKRRWKTYRTRARQMCHGIRANICQLYVTDLCKQGLWIFWSNRRTWIFSCLLGFALVITYYYCLLLKVSRFFVFTLQNFQAMVNREPTKPGTIMSLRSNN